MLLGTIYLSRFPTKLGAYNALQVCLMRHYIARGGQEQDWCTRMAARFRARYGWMLAERPVEQTEKPLARIR